jgi:two-component system OmpR family sensor kinase
MKPSEWLDEASRSSLRRQYGIALSMLVLVLVVTALISAIAVIWASSIVRGQAQEIVDLQTANRDVLQDMTDAETGVRGYGLSDDPKDLVAYELAMNHLPLDQKGLRELAVGRPALTEAITRQDRAIRVWISEYATPQLPPETPSRDEEVELFTDGRTYYNEIRQANLEVASEIELVTEDIQRDSRNIMLLALVAVALFPVLGVYGVHRIARRLNRSVVDPLTDIAAVLERLRVGDTRARAELTGAEEIREIAAALNSLTEENLRASEMEADVLSQLEMIDRVRTDLVSTVSHELRTPLTSINGYLELLQDQLMDDLTRQQQSMVGVIRRNLDRLNELITNLLALSKAEETQFAVEPLDLRAVAAEVATDIRLTAASKDVTVRTLQSATPIVILGDRSQLIRAVLNLASNAVKFSRPGGAIELRVHQEGAEAVLEVVDEGIGIPKGDLPGLGSRFYRASNAMRAEIAGTGLGLRIVQTILDRHEGTLSVDSVEGEGSTFTLRLPVRTAAYSPPPGPMPQAVDSDRDRQPIPDRVGD